MGLFICEKCGAIENTALGMYWASEYAHYKDHPELDGKLLCSECVPLYYDDGSATGFTGEWHGNFKKEYAKDFTPKQLRDMGLE